MLMVMEEERFGQVDFSILSRWTDTFQWNTEKGSRGKITYVKLVRAANHNNQFIIKYLLQIAKKLLYTRTMRIIALVSKRDY